MKELSHLFTRETPRQIILEDFKIDLPITGGWGYDFESACVIDKNDPIVNQTIPFNGVSIEYIFVEKRIYDEKFSGIRWDLEKQELLFQNEKPYNKLTFKVVGFADEVWEELTRRFEELKNKGQLDLLPELDAYRDSKAYRFTREYYFNISSFYGQP